MGTVKKKNISGEDLEVGPLGYATVKAGEEVDVPTHYEWHREPHGKPGDDDYDPGADGTILWPESVWADVTPAKATKSTATKE
jgi:hypothetical protein